MFTGPYVHVTLNLQYTINVCDPPSLYDDDLSLVLDISAAFAGQALA